MRWPLRNQILLSMMGVTLITLVAVSALNVVLSARVAGRQIERQLQDVARTLAESSFPLTDSVLRQMRGLSGAEYVLVDDSGGNVASSDSALSAGDLPQQARLDDLQNLALDRTVQLRGERYFHCALALRRTRARTEPARLHVLYPRRSYREALWQAMLPPILVGSVALLLAAGLGVWLAARVTRPVRRLQRQVDQIAEGDFRPMPIAGRNDEIRDLGRAINRMAEMLADYEEDVRRSEKLRTLGQLRGGIAHQMRNAVTGCRVALDLYRREHGEHEDDEALQVARRQLALIEKHLQCLLTLGASPDKPQKPVELASLVENVLDLVGPMAQHVGVLLESTVPETRLTVRGDAEALEQLLVNLLLNAIDAASATAHSAAAAVTVELRRAGEHDVRLEVKDSGPGPAPHVQAKLFEPLVTEKRDGVGLGLSVAREIAVRHGGTITWHREGATTCFCVTLPRLQVEDFRVEAAGR